ncbi:MAG TPA: acyl-CoA thioesterase [Bacteroidia bacterium]|nr:acyl-CoA thioesterase [Bacteroidia bacterium]
MSLQTQITIRIDWSELDLFGHVNNVAFHKYAQTARLNYVQAIGLMKLHQTQNIGFMVAETNCQFKKELLFPGNINIQTQIDFVKNTSLALQHIMTNDTGELVAMARDVLVVFDFNKKEKVLIPEEIKAKVS